MLDFVQIVIPATSVDVTIHFTGYFFKIEALVAPFEGLWEECRHPISTNAICPVIVVVKCVCFLAVASLLHISVKDRVVVEEGYEVDDSTQQNMVHEGLVLFGDPVHSENPSHSVHGFEVSLVKQVE
jgi:hypothetical protein